VATIALDSMIRNELDNERVFMMKEMDKTPPSHFDFIQNTDRREL